MELHIEEDREGIEVSITQCHTQTYMNMKSEFFYFCVF